MKLNLTYIKITLMLFLLGVSAISSSKRFGTTITVTETNNLISNIPELANCPNLKVDKEMLKSFDLDGFKDKFIGIANAAKGSIVETIERVGKRLSSFVKKLKEKFNNFINKNEVNLNEQDEVATEVSEIALKLQNSNDLKAAVNKLQTSSLGPFIRAGQDCIDRVRPNGHSKRKNRGNIAGLMGAYAKMMSIAAVALAIILVVVSAVLIISLGPIGVGISLGLLAMVIGAIIVWKKRNNL